MKKNPAASGQHFRENIFVEMLAEHLLGRATFVQSRSNCHEYFIYYPPRSWGGKPLETTDEGDTRSTGSFTYVAGLFLCSRPLTLQALSLIHI